MKFEIRELRHRSKDSLSDIQLSWRLDIEGDTGVLTFQNQKTCSSGRQCQGDPNATTTSRADGARFTLYGRPFRHPSPGRTAYTDSDVSAGEPRATATRTGIERLSRRAGT